MKFKKTAIGSAAALVAFAPTVLIFLSRDTNHVFPTNMLKTGSPYATFWYEKGLLNGYVSPYMMEFLLISGFIALLGFGSVILQNYIFPENVREYVTPSFAIYVANLIGFVAFCLGMRYFLLYLVQSHDNSRTVFGSEHLKTDPLLYFIAPQMIAMFSFMTGGTVAMLSTLIGFKIARRL